ncbi:MAG: NADH-quinone oxidoreductase subunit L [Pirellulales bacterium]|nr:NADH-quinone oxidoreductase subunit L [Pirellulales bacterium]
MPSAKTLLVVIPAMPLLAAALTAVLGPRLLRTRSHWPTVLGVAFSFAASLLLLFQVHQQVRAEKNATFPSVTLWQWVDVDSSRLAAARTAALVESTAEAGAPPAAKQGTFSINVALQADPLTCVMLAVVTCISLLVAIYSIGYMRGDRGYWRFFSYIPLFVFSMTMLVSASNFLLLYVFWELVGLCSYLLIGFWYQRPAAAAAGKKAFLVNRIGDFGFALGVFLLWTTYGTLNYEDLFGPHHLPYAREALGTAICLLLLAGACGKSAQFPLHVWLPDAMEGPSPVSALIHAATMVTAGVYLVARCLPMFREAPGVLHVVAIIGGGTALLGAIIAVTQTDLKRILAYSTISHLGYMFLALGTGTLLGAVAGMFHLVTHAFFKSLLFLAAGSVMHAMGGVIDIRRFSGLRRRMPITHWTFLFGGLSMAGVIPFAGFFSKDAILLSLAECSGGLIYQTLYWTTFGGIVLIVLYTFRPYFIAFFGPEKIPKEAGDHAHESPRVMTWTLVILAFVAFSVGMVLEWNHVLSDFLAATPSWTTLPLPPAPEVLAKEHLAIALQSSAAVLITLACTAALYLGTRRVIVARLTGLLKLVGIYQLSFGKFFFDQIYWLFIILPAEGFAALCAWADNHVIDGLVNLCGAVPRWFGAALRPLQGGLIQFYALSMAIGLLIMLFLLLL